MKEHKLELSAPKLVWLSTPPYGEVMQFLKPRLKGNQPTRNNNHGYQKINAHWFFQSSLNQNESARQINLSQDEASSVARTTAYNNLYATKTETEFRSQTGLILNRNDMGLSLNWVSSLCLSFWTLLKAFKFGVNANCVPLYHVHLLTSFIQLLLFFRIFSPLSFCWFTYISRGFKTVPQSLLLLPQVQPTALSHSLFSLFIFKFLWNSGTCTN